MNNSSFIYLKIQKYIYNIKKIGGTVMKKIRYLLLFVLIVTFFSISIILKNMEDSTILSNANTLSNKKIGWGIKRNNNHEQPDLGSENIKILTENHGIAIGNSESKKIYLTFDEGYEAGYTPEILKVLKQNRVKAAFFITAHFVNTEPDLVKEMIDEGHIVGNHTINHKSMPDLNSEQIKSEVMRFASNNL